MRLLLVVPALLSVVALAPAQSVQVAGADVTAKGTYEAQVTSKQTGVPTAAGTSNTVVNWHFTADTTTFPARIGTRFGFTYVLYGSPNGVEVTVRTVNIFPPGGLTNTRTGRTFESDEDVSTATIGKTSLRGYVLEQDWEAVPGPWTQQVWYQGQLLAEVVFTLTKP